MKKLLLLLLLFSAITAVRAQSLSDRNFSPNMLFENIHDHYGTKYTLSDIRIEPTKNLKSGSTSTTITIACATTSYFNLYFETGCGMENTSDPAHNARRAVLCQVLQDLSNFIKTPLTTNGLNNKVNIWVRNINNIVSSPNGVLGLASSFYTFPSNSTANFGGIADNEIWKTIHSGVDSYTNVTSPLITNGINSNLSGVFYHGLVAMNFNTNNSPAINWNTNLNANAPSGQYDLYSVVLHEITHALGFASLISNTGASRFNTGYNYYSRYDRFLKTDNNLPLLGSTNTCTAANTMYDYTFNTALTNNLHPGCTTINNGPGLNISTCGNAIKYVGTSTVPVYTPTCFEPPSSLSHFEDMLYPTCQAPHGNDAYFVMSNKQSNLTNPTNTKRYLRPEERNVLCDLGYDVKNTFGTASTFNGTYNYGGAASCGGMDIAGVNDGITSMGAFTYIGNPGSNIVINNILSNDRNAVSFECLQDVYAATTLSATSGTAATNVNFNSNVEGLHLLRYVPVNSAGQKGNITYLYVYVKSVNNCASPSACNYVINGGFEENSMLPDNYGQQNNNQIGRCCNWTSGNYATPDYYHRSSVSADVKIPCNTYGLQETSPVTNNNAYAALAYFTQISSASGNWFEVISTRLSKPLSPNTKYQLKLNISQAEAMSKYGVKFQAYLSPTPVPFGISTGYIPIANLNMLKTSTTYSGTTNGWETVVLNFQTGSVSGEEYLYIGVLNDYQFLLQTPVMPNQVSGCPSYTLTQYNNNAFPDNRYSYYYIDNVSLVEVNLTFELPGSICQSQTLPNLSSYVTPNFPNGYFTGPGITSSSGNYSFSGASAGLGTHTIAYNYINNLGCTVSIYSQITVSECSSTSCPGSLVFNTTQPTTTATYQAFTSIITNGSYLVNSGTTLTLKAGNSITFSPNSDVKSGSNFTAQIGPCVQTSARSSDEDENAVVAKDDLNIYPNPSKNIVTIEMVNNQFIKLVVIALDGKLILNKTIESAHNYQLDISDYNNGLYILSVQTADGKSISKKIIKY